jgi:DNA-binding MarR family transcriptional regulator
MSDTESGAGRVPLSALLSEVLVAFIIEFDNEFERQMPHRTSNHGKTPGQRAVPWLVSMAMWSNCMRFIGEDGTTVGELARRARTGTNLRGMQRWGYITIEPDPADRRPKPPRSGWIIRATTSGRRAQQVWLPLTGIIEARWAERFGADDITNLREALRAVASQLDPALPDCLPILGYGLWSTPDRARPAADPVSDSRLGPAMEPGQLPADLPALLSRVLLAFAIEFEHESPVSLAISANAFRVLADPRVRVRDLPGLSGVSKEAISMAMGILTKGELVVSGPAPDGGRWQVATLTPQGRSAQNKCRERLGQVEDRWQARFGGHAVSGLRQAAERLAGDPGRAQLLAGLRPPPGGWRASVRGSATLPQYPMVLHRGGFPDGS